MGFTQQIRSTRGGSLGGAHFTLGKPLIDAARQEQLMDGVVFVISGVLPPDDTVRLKEIGFDASSIFDSYQPIGYSCRHPLLQMNVIRSKEQV